MPELAPLYFDGAALTTDTSSCTVVAGTDGLTVNSNGAWATSPIAVKSLTASYLIVDLYSSGTIEWIDAFR